MRPEPSQIQADCRVLTQLVLEPVHGVGMAELVPGSTSDHLPVHLGDGSLDEPFHRRFDARLTVDVVDLVEEVHPALSICQLHHGRRLDRNQHLDHRGMVNEHFQGDDRAGADADDDRRLLAQVLDQAPNIVSVCLDAMIPVLRPIELASGEAPRAATAPVAPERLVRAALPASKLPAGAQETCWAAASRSYPGVSSPLVACLAMHNSLEDKQNRLVTFWAAQLSHS